MTGDFLEAIDRHPLSVAPQTRLLDAIQQMAAGQGCVLVTQEGRLLGLLDEQTVVGLVAAKTDLNGSIAGVMSRQFMTLEWAQIQTGCDVLSLMSQHRIRYLPIVNEGYLAGLVRFDRLGCCFRADQPLPPQPNDRQNESTILQVAEAALQENQQMLWTLMSNLPGMAYRFLNDEQLTIKYASDGCFALTGYQVEDLIDNKRVAWEQLDHPDDRALIRSTIDAALAKDEPFQLTYRLITASGAEKWVWEQGRRVFSQEGLEVLEGVIFDMTERERVRLEKEQAQTALQKSEATNRALIAAIPDLMMRMTGDGTYVDFFPAREFKGFMPHVDRRGKNIFDVMPIAIAEQRMRDIEQALATGKTQIREFELLVNGEIYYQESRVTVSGEDEVLVIIRDISQRRQAEIALRESEERFRSLVANIPGVVYRCQYNNNWTELFISDFAEEITGYPAADFLNDRRRSWSSIVHPDDRHFTEKSVDEAVVARKPFVIEYRILHRDGSIRWVYEKGQATFDATEGVLYLDGAIFEITERKRAEADLQRAKDNLERRVQARTAELRQINQQLQQEMAERQRVEALNALLAKAVENAGDAIEVTDLDVVIQYVNPAAEATTGYSREELIGKTPAMLLRSGLHDEAYYREMVAKAMAGQVWRGELISRHKDGALLYQDVTIAPVLDAAEKIISLVAVKRDITQRKAAEASIRQSEARFRRVVDSNMIGMFFADADAQITEANDAFLAIVGYTREELYAGKMNYRSMTPVDHLESTKQITDELRLFGVSKTYEKEYLHKNGTRIPVLVGVALMEDEARLDSDVTFVLDITKRREVEQQLKASLNEKELLLKEVHHRVKNNLQVISSIFSLHSQYLFDPVTLSILEDCQQRIDSMALIHEKLYQCGSFAKVDFADYIQNLASNLFTTYTTRRDLIHLNLQISDVSLNLDTAIPCGLLLNELVSNALKHAFPDRQSGEVTIAFSSDSENNLNLVVQDNGVGLPANLDLQQTTSLGLRLVRALTRQLQGKLKISNDNGARFEITFPQPKRSI